MDKIDVRGGGITTKEYQEAVDNIDRVMGQLSAATQGRTVEKLTESERENFQNLKKLKDRYLNVLVHGSFEKHENLGLVKKFKEVSFVNRDVGNFLSNRMYRMIDFYEKMIKNNSDDCTKLVNEYNQMNLSISIDSIDLDTCEELVSVMYKYNENQQKIDVVEGSIAGAKEEVKNVDEKIKYKELLLNKLNKAIHFHEERIKKIDDECSLIVDEYNKLNPLLPIESLGLDAPSELLDLKRRYDNNRSKKRTVESHVERIKKESIVVVTEIKIFQGIRNTLLERVDVLANHFALKLEKYNSKKDLIIGEYNKLKLPVPIESLDLAKCSNLVDLKKKYIENKKEQKVIEDKMQKAKEELGTLQDEIVRSTLALRELNARQT